MATNIRRGILVAVSGIAGLVLAATLVQARLLDIKLADLVKKSEFIAFGESTSTTSTASRVSFQPKQVLKGEAPANDGEIILCNQPDNIESYDLRAMKAPYVVFAVPKRDCYQPVHGASSIIEVEDGTARTVSIIDQPSGQPLQTFLAQIKPCPVVQ